MPAIVIPQTKHYFFDEKLTTAVATGLQETLREMCRMSCDFEDSFIAQNWHPVGQGTGSVDLYSDQERGKLRLHFSEGAVLAMMNKLLGRSPLNLNEEALDCIGSITDVVYGRMRTILNPHGYKLKMALPQMHYTSRLGRAEGNVTHLITPFRVANTTCYIEVIVNV